LDILAAVKNIYDLPAIKVLDNLKFFDIPFLALGGREGGLKIL